MAASLGMDAAKGALISGVAKGGPVENGPIQAGDVVLKFDGKDINEMRDLLRIVAESPVGKEVDVVVFRDGKEETVKVKLGQLLDAPDEKAATEDPQAEDGDGGMVVPDDKGGTDDQAQDQTPEVREAPQRVLGMNLVVLSNELRTEKGIAESVEGVLVASVDQGSPAEQKGMKAGDVIVEVGQDFMEVPGDEAGACQRPEIRRPQECAYDGCRCPGQSARRGAAAGIKRFRLDSAGIECAVFSSPCEVEGGPSCSEHGAT
ncbi:MAG: PDZ domain-containing protein [Agrobacterium sp.]|nr:PDZ domain-containing protein [Agrobacterium sp.]